MELFRAKKLYTAKNYRTFLETFRKNFPNYVYFCPFRGKEVIAAPLNAIEKVYVPKESLQLLLKKKSKDNLQKITIDLIKLL
ncbi:hypothetical protein J7L33_02475, partial [Candidatus Bathyarchaeota archaeon]|nr:hypothetical protein [Candidatus Bathyarchaeota archaeon]